MWMTSNILCCRDAGKGVAAFERTDYSDFSCELPKETIEWFMRNENQQNLPEDDIREYLTTVRNTYYVFRDVPDNIVLGAREICLRDIYESTEEKLKMYRHI